MIDPLEAARVQPATVRLNALQVLVLGQEIAPEEEPIEGTNLVAGVEQHGHEGGADVATSTGNQNTLHDNRPFSGVRDN